MDCWGYWNATSLCERCTKMDQWRKEMRGEWNVKVAFRFPRVIGTKWHLQGSQENRPRLSADHGVYAVSPLSLSLRFQINLIRERNMKWRTERWLTLSFFRFNYHLGRGAAVITVVNASADLGRIFSFKFLDAPISSRLSRLVIGPLINPDVMSRCSSAHEDSCIY